MKEKTEKETTAKTQHITLNDVMIAITIIYWFIPSNDSHIFPTLACSSSPATSFFSVFLFFLLLFYFIFLSVLSCKKTCKRKKKINFLCFFLFLVSQEKKRKHWKIKLEPKRKKSKKKINNKYIELCHNFFMLHILCLRCCNSQFTRPISLINLTDVEVISWIILLWVLILEKYLPFLPLSELEKKDSGL